MADISSIKIPVDTSELDVAIEKADLLIEKLNTISQMSKSLNAGN